MTIKSKLKKYFNPFPDKEDERQTIEVITSAVRFRGAQLWVLVFAIFIASLGLNVNSTAVVIGAMPSWDPSSAWGWPWALATGHC